MAREVPVTLEPHEHVGGCCLAAPLQAQGITLPMAALGDEEGARLPASMPPVVDAHVHLFPDGVFNALWRWFERNIWPVRYQLQTPDVLRFLLSRGVQRVVALHYSHKPGMARVLNEYVAGLCAQEPRVIGLATVFPGEPGAATILRDAFARGLRGVKLHCHVQCVAPDDEGIHEVAAECVRANVPLVMHAGREPASPAYKVDVRALCSAERVEHLLLAHPALKLVVPHLGFDEVTAYERMLERFDHLWLDTTMTCADYFPIRLPARLLDVRPDRVLYGSDFPNLPYAWDRELKTLRALRLGDAREARLFGQNALDLYGEVVA